MIVVLNPNAGGGTAITRWPDVRNALPLDEPVKVYTLAKGVDLSAVVNSALHEHERDFIAAGGDGTMNALVNALIPHIRDGRNYDIRCGAIGLGSSNDFHKPFDSARMLGRIPFKVNLDAAQPRDIGVVRFENGGVYRERFFLINASIGVTASANSFFNHPDVLLSFLKRSFPGTAIMYAAIKTLLRYKNLRVTITDHSGSEMLVQHLTNLGIVKSPHVSGILRYDCRPLYATGSFRVYLCDGLGTGARLGLLRRLSHGEFRENERCRTWETRAISVCASEPFPVEVDGEILTTRHASVAILPCQLKVCS